MMERVVRCQHLTWDIGEQVLTKKGNVVLDIGFMTKAQREYVINNDEGGRSFCQSSLSQCTN